MDWISIAAGQQAAAVPPAPVFLDTFWDGGKLGAWYDPSDLSTMWQDTAATTPVTTAGQLVARIDDKSPNGYHMTQATSSKRPTYQTDGTLHWLDFDGISDGMGSAIMAGTQGDTVDVFAAVRKVTSATTGVFLEYGPDTAANFGSFALFHSAGNGYDFGNKGSGPAVFTNVSSGYTPPVTSQITGRGEVSTSSPLTQLRINGSIAASLTLATGGTFYGDRNLYMGARANSSLYADCLIYGAVVRFNQGDTTSLEDIGEVEAYLAAKAGL